MLNNTLMEICIVNAKKTGHIFKHNILDILNSYFTFVVTKSQKKNYNLVFAKTHLRREGAGKNIYITASSLMSFLLNYIYF